MIQVKIMKALDRRGKGENLATKRLSTKIGVLAFGCRSLMKTRCIFSESTHLQLDACRGSWCLTRSLNWPSSDTSMWGLILSSKRFTSGILKEDAEMLCIHLRKAVKIPHNAILIVPEHANSLFAVLCLYHLLHDYSLYNRVQRG